MKQTAKQRIVLCLLLLTVMTACSDQPETPNKGTAAKDPNAPLSVYVVNYPLYYFAERIGGAHVEVIFPAPADVDPAFWKPRVEQIAAYQKADLIVLNGASYAKWVPRVSLPASRVINTSASFADRYISIAGQVIHSHGATGNHQHGDLAFTTWLDPLLAIFQAQAIRDALVRLRPNSAGEFQQRFAALESDLRELDTRLAEVVAAGGSQPLVFSHPVYQYFIRRYTIDGYTVNWEPKAMPSPDQWQELERLLAQHPAQWMVWEGPPDPSTVARLKQRGLESVVFDPCGNLPEEGDYLRVMEDNLRRLSQALEEGA